MSIMTTLMEQAVRAVGDMPVSTQNELARYLLESARDPAVLSSDEALAIAEAEAELARGERADRDEVQAFWTSHGLGSEQVAA